MLNFGAKKNHDVQDRRADELGFAGFALGSNRSVAALDTKENSFDGSPMRYFNTILRRRDSTVLRRPIESSLDLELRIKFFLNLVKGNVNCNSVEKAPREWLKVCSGELEMPPRGPVS